MRKVKLIYQHFPPPLPFIVYTMCSLLPYTQVIAAVVSPVEWQFLFLQIAELEGTRGSLYSPDTRR